jgi:hypothetical protein
MSNNNALVQKIVQIVRTNTNPKQGLSNLKQNQNIVPGIVSIIKGSVGANAAKVVNSAPANDVAKAITILFKNNVKIPSTVAQVAIPKLETGGESTVAAQVIQKANSSDVAKAITNLLKNSVKLSSPVTVAAIPTLVAGGESAVAAQVIRQSNASDVAKAITNLIRNSVKLSSPVTVAAIPTLVTGGEPNAAVEVIRQSNANDVAKVITNLTQNGVKIPKQVANAAIQTLEADPTPEHKNLANKLKKPFKWPWSGFFSPKGKMEGPQTQPNFIAPTITGKDNMGRNTYNQTPPMPGYVFTTWNGNPGWYRNKPPVPAPVPGPSGPPRNYSKMSIRELLKSLRETPANRSSILDVLRKALERELRDIKNEYSRSRRARKLGDLLRLLPRNYNGRRNASSMVVNDVRETRNNRELSNLRSNLGSVPNENIRRAFEDQRRRLTRNKNVTRRPVYTPPVRRYGESNTNYARRVNNSDKQRELLELMRRRRAARIGGAGNGGGYGSGSGGGYGVGSGSGYGAGNGGGPGNGGVPPPPIPTNQRRAINNAGGVNKVMNTVVQVPGGAPEIAKAAEALNETGGNAVTAITIKGASPAAVNAVKKLGGSTNAVNVLEGLNTMSQTKATRKRKAGTRRRTKVLKPRVAELNRVLSAVKKQKLISLAAHNVTKTHNIHPNDEKLKKYYKKVLKANILRTPFAKIVKKAAKKNK